MHYGKALNILRGERQALIYSKVLQVWNHLFISKLSTPHALANEPQLTLVPFLDWSDRF